MKADPMSLQPGPCVICGCTNYALSMGGPTICPACDCGATDHAVNRQRIEIERLRAAAKAVEDWWLSEGMKHFDGAPYAIFAIRAALRNEDQQTARQS